MNHPNKIIIHCSATQEGLDFRARDVKRWHLNEGYADIGYHYIIDLDGTIEKGRNEDVIGAHCKGQNSQSIGICYIGGLDTSNAPKDTRTVQQKAALYRLITDIRERYGNLPVYGHNEFANKACPCFDVQKEWGE